MFQWLAKLLLDTPVASSGCPCCEAKRVELETMRREIVGEKDPEACDEKRKEDLSFNTCKCQDYLVKKYGVFFQDGYGLPVDEDNKEK